MEVRFFSATPAHQRDGSLFLMVAEAKRGRALLRTKLSHGDLPGYHQQGQSSSSIQSVQDWIASYIGMYGVVRSTYLHRTCLCLTASIRKYLRNTPYLLCTYISAYISIERGGRAGGDETSASHAPNGE